MITIKLPYKDNRHADEVVQWCSEQGFRLRYYEDQLHHRDWAPYYASEDTLYLTFFYILDEELTLLRLRWGA